MCEQRYPNMLLYGQIGGTRPRGRPRKKGLTTSKKTAQRRDFHWSRRTDLHVTGTDETCCAEVGLSVHVDYVFIAKAFSQAD